MPDPTPDVAAIARGLTKAQRKAIMAARVDVKSIANLDWAAWDELVGKHLLHATGLSITDLGRAVAAYLAEGEAR